MRPAPLPLVLLMALFSLQSQHSIADPQSHYRIHCMGCHLQDGRGLPPDVPAFTTTLAEFARTDKGREYLVRVPGAAQSPIDDAALAGVINWILAEYSGTKDFPPFAAGEVTRYRQLPLSNPELIRQQLLDGTD